MKYIFQITISIILGFLFNLLIFSYVIIFGLPDLAYGPLIYGALLEESQKLLFFTALYKIKIHPYAIAFTGVGYGFFEQFVKIVYGSDPSLVTLWMHISAGIIMALMIKKAFDLKSKKYVFSAFFLPFLIHFGFNGILMLYAWIEPLF